MPTWRRSVAVLLLIAATVSCSDGGGDGSDEAADGEESTTTTAAATVTCPGADGRSRELRRCLEGSFAFIETPIAAGSGVLLDDGHIVTNAHVVDPYDEVRVTFPGGESFEEVEVVGVDAFADIAVLDVVDVEADGLTLGDNPDFEDEDEPEVFLVGYPGGSEGDDPQITLASGILSRTRQSDEFDATYLQTDAAIAGGQSGGALVDEEGTLLGISGLSFAEEFALALSVDDVADSVEKILDGDGDERRTIPAPADTTPGPTSIDLTVPDTTAAVIIPADEDDRTVRIEVQGDRPVAVDVNSYFEPLGSNQAAIDSAQEFLGDDFDEDDYPLMPEVAPGQYEFEAPDGDDVIITLNFADRGTGAIQFASDAGYVVYQQTAAPTPIAVGDEIQSTVDSFTFEDLYTIELQEGDEIEITVRSPVADPYYVLFEPDEPYLSDEDPTADDEGGGLWDLDAQDTHRIDTPGTYTIAIGTYDGIVAGYVLTVEDVS